MRAAVVGQGYVGLVTSAVLAEWDHDVIGIEADPVRVEALSAGRIPIHEPGLEDLVGAHRASGRLRFVERHEAAVAAAHVVIVAVGTTDVEGNWQTATMWNCLAEVVPDVADDAVLVIRSTLPPAFVRQLGPLVSTLRMSAGRPPIPVLLNPEFTREGTAINDFLRPDRVVIGVADDPNGLGVALLHRLYAQVDAPILVMSEVDACLAKLGANLFLATKISFANELATLCDTFGATVDRVVDAIAHDARIGGAFLRAGIGFGGSCLPHQVTQTVRLARGGGFEAPLLAAVDAINHRQRTAFVDRIVELLGGNAEGQRVALLGLTFKPNTDDIRDAPSLAIASQLLDAGATVVAYDPMPRARNRSLAMLPGILAAQSAAEALAGADAAALVTEWPEFVSLDWAAAGTTMRRRIVVDGRNALPAAEIVRAGFVYCGFGRGVTMPVSYEGDGTRATVQVARGGLPQLAPARIAVES